MSNHQAVLPKEDNLIFTKWLCLKKLLNLHQMVISQIPTK